MNVKSTFITSVILVNLSSLFIAVSVSTASVSTCGNLFVNIAETSQNEKTYYLLGSDAESIDLIQQYLAFQKSIYNERLLRYSEMTPSERVQTDFHDINDRERSVFLISTKNEYKPGQKIEFLGGIRAVFSNSPNQLLPFERELKVKKISLPPGQISVEIGRLTSDVKLISKILKKLLKNEDIKWFYVHTSKAHAKRYRQLGFIPNRMLEKDELNIVLAFQREDLLQLNL